MTSVPRAEETTLVVVVVGGDPDTPVRFPEFNAARPTVVAVDGGLEHVLAAGWRADHVIGDLDSASASALAAAIADGAAIHRHLADKDEIGRAHV